MTEKEIMQYLETVGKLDCGMELGKIRELLRRMGDPQDDLQFIHIAGTNGKGSTVAYISTILRCAGYRVGRYISPTIFSYFERIQVNEKPISKKGFGELLEYTNQIIQEMVAEGFGYPSVFEIETALGFLYFKQKKCDIVVLETGMGGELDATNVVKNTLAAVFTSISMDHMDFLGKNLREIAGQKAGIIKNGCYVIVGTQESHVDVVLRERAELMGCPVIHTKKEQVSKIKSKINKQVFDYVCSNRDSLIKWDKLEITLNGKHQIENAILALETVVAISDQGFKISRDDIYRGLRETTWAGRFTVLCNKPMFVVDGAHNEDAAKRLAENIEFYFKDKRILFILGVLKDKEYDKMIQITAPYAEHIITISTPNNERALSSYDLAKAIEPYHKSVTAADSIQEAVELSFLLAEKEDVIIAFGSLSYLGILMEEVAKRSEYKKDTHGKEELE